MNARLNLFRRVAGCLFAVVWLLPGVATPTLAQAPQAETARLGRASQAASFYNDSNDVISFSTPDEATPQVDFSSPPLEPNLLHNWPRQIVEFSEPGNIDTAIELGYFRFTQAQLPGSSNVLEDAGGNSARRSDGNQKLGEAPEESNANLQFLRNDSILLDPGKYQIEVTVQYLVNENDAALAEIIDGFLIVGEARRRQRLMMVPIEFRLGLTSQVQGFVNVPFGWSNSEIAFAGEDSFGNVGGIGDVSGGLTRLFWKEKDNYPTVLGTFAFSAPTGNSSLATSLSVPQSSLGEGFWTMTMALTAIKTYDPIVLYYGLGYRHRFDNTIDGFSVSPGHQAFYRLGAGIAVNPKMTFSVEFFGSFLGRDKINGIPTAGSIREPIGLRFATTIVRGNKNQANRSVRTVEPFVNIGLSSDAVDTVFGISWTR